MSTKSANKSKYAQQRKQEGERQKRMRRLIWGTVAVVAVAIIAVAFLTRPSTTSADFDYDKMPVMGSAEAPIKIVEFGDYKCSACKIFNQSILPQLKKDYIDSGKVAVYFKNFTIIAPDSTTAALAAQGVYHQDNDSYWKFTDAIYKNQGSETVQWATPDYLVELAKKENIGVDYDKLKQDIVNATYQNEVDADNRLARSKALGGTPTLFLNGEKLGDSVGLNYDKLQTEIEKALQGDK